MATSAGRRRILVTGATGKQGGAVVNALLQLESKSNEFHILGLTRNASSTEAQSLASNENIEIVTGDLNHASDIFEKTGGLGSIWGVFSVQVVDMKGDPHSDENREYRQGINMIDAALKYGVQHFVQASVDRGGAKSDDNPTNIGHFITKHRIEQYLREKTAGSRMSYTILRPVAFMDLFTPDFTGRLFAALIGTLGDKPLQLVATKDIGIFAAQAFASADTDEYNNAAISLAGDELTQKGCNEAFWKALHRPMPVGSGLMARLVLWMVPEMGHMFQWFKDVGYDIDISHCRKLNSAMLDLPTFLEQESAFRKH